MDDRVQQLPCGVMVLDDQMRVRSVNDTLLAMMVHRREDVEGKPVDVILPKGGRIFLQTHFVPLVKMYGRTEEVYFELLDAEGTRIPVLINAVHRESADDSTIECVVVRVSQRARYEQAMLEARREAERASREKSRLLSILSHDFRTPLQAISGYAEALAREFHGPLQDEQREAVDVIRTAGRELARFLDDLLDLETIESGRIRVLRERVGVEEALERALALTRIRAEEAGIDLSHKPAPSGAAVSADPDRLQQILLNLVTNAAKFTPSGGRITIWYEERGETGRIRVRDTGPGIDPGKSEEIFEPFVQLDAENSRGHGVGLGLSISREFARAMQGDVKVESSPGEGSTFTIELPLWGTEERNLSG